MNLAQRIGYVCGWLLLLSIPFTGTPAWSLEAPRLTTGLPLCFESEDAPGAPFSPFVARRPSGDVRLDASGLTLSSRVDGKPARVALRVVEGRRDARGEPLEPMAGRANHLTGADPRQWRTNVPLFGKVRFQDVYPEIDVVYYGRHGELECDFIVRPGGDPRRIALQCDGPGALDLREDGRLEVSVGAQALVLRAPVTYQDIDGLRREVRSRFVLGAHGLITFEIGDYDPDHVLVIDPVIELSTTVGLSGPETRGVGVDREGNLYLSGFTSAPSLDLPGPHWETTLNGPADIFVVKLDPTGTSVLYATYVGGSDRESCKAMAVTPDGEAFLTGNTKSSDYPVTPGAINRPSATYDIFVTKLNRTGDGLAYSCRFGGSAMEEARGITVDSRGHCIVVGGTHSPEFPTTSGAHQSVYNDPPEATPDVAGSFVNGEDAFIAKLNPAGTAFVFCTFLGGHGFEKAWAVATDGADDIYVAGHVEAGDFPVTEDAFQSRHGGGLTREQGEQYGAKDAFLAKLSSDGTRVLAATYFGGSGQDVGYGVGVDGSGRVYLAGNTDSRDLPLQAPAFNAYRGGTSDVFVARFDARLTRLEYATYLGGTGHDELASDAFAVDTHGFASGAGSTTSTDFPVTPNAFLDAYRGGDSDACLFRLQPDGKLDFASYLGGGAMDKCGDLALDAQGRVYAAGTTKSADFAQTTGHRGEAFVVRLRAGSTAEDK